jgi:hypothetical protein
MNINELVAEVEKIPGLIKRIEALEKANAEFKPMAEQEEEYMSIQHFLDKHKISDTTFSKARKQFGYIPEKYKFKTKLLFTVDCNKAIKQYQPVKPIFKTKKKAAPTKKPPKLVKRNEDLEKVIAEFKPVERQLAYTV